MINQWEQIRWQTTCLINIQVKKRDQKTPERMFPFSWEKTPEVNVRKSTREDFNRLVKKYQDAE